MAEHGSDDDRAAGVDRRSAMKAVLGAATAAAVWQAPRVEGFTLAPDYAAAASGPGGAGTGTVNRSLTPTWTTGGQQNSSCNRTANSGPSHNGQGCCAVCWNTGAYQNCFSSGGCNGGGSCCQDDEGPGQNGSGAYGCAGNPTTGTISIPKASPAGTNIDLTYSMRGLLGWSDHLDAGDNTTGTQAHRAQMTMTVNGIDPPHQSCQVQVQGTCYISRGGTVATGNQVFAVKVGTAAVPYNTALNSNTDTRVVAAQNGTFTGPSFAGNGTVNFSSTGGTSPVLRPSCAIGRHSNANPWCNMSANMTITLNCTFL